MGLDCADAMDLHRRAGRIELFLGPMFSGKTSRLISALRSQSTRGLSVLAVKASHDERYDSVCIVSHDMDRLSAVPVRSAAELAERAAGPLQVVGIDELQFFDEGIVDVALALAARGVAVYAAGLDLDFAGRPFGSSLLLAERADAVHVCTGTCSRCARPATRSLRLGASTALVEIGAEERYEPVCRTCHERFRTAPVPARPRADDDTP